MIKSEIKIERKIQTDIFNDLIINMSCGIILMHGFIKISKKQIIFKSFENWDEKWTQTMAIYS